MQALRIVRLRARRLPRRITGGIVRIARRRLAIMSFATFIIVAMPDGSRS